MNMFCNGLKGNKKAYRDGYDQIKWEEDMAKCEDCNARVLLDEWESPSVILCDDCRWKREDRQVLIDICRCTREDREFLQKHGIEAEWANEDDEAADWAQDEDESWIGHLGYDYFTDESSSIVPMSSSLRLNCDDCGRY